ncbi:uncharacterized protein MONOS_4287 [Monocercomonoides exilis]|uniref:uncharacterized protein n=1 Tax=Monocercomonoides exilis TaxID=2049356 RepID=UPI00355A14E7|nr:hypothetical protein MONOS_4287 [Monocercomonoides exilis]|eukprot:MONOS_4287.1-p1 / transcript=MONOS_4287.1 / gene=MONOS_4287 / organism=Monocercomonoides_exilis_PA203 / gene_product=unspecified product / transcript_product=unspecified product / location=Mono_scaffold00112:33456-34157(+) / protein_length=189 / sequence_SO=supercontig / SO=protein_coding / is_pseudo=false
MGYEKMSEKVPLDLLQQCLRYLSDNKLEDALNDVNKILKLDPEHQTAKALKAQLLSSINSKSSKGSSATNSTESENEEEEEEESEEEDIKDSKSKENVPLSESNEDETGEFSEEDEVDDISRASLSYDLSKQHPLIRKAISAQSSSSTTPDPQLLSKLVSSKEMQDKLNESLLNDVKKAYELLDSQVS